MPGAAPPLPEPQRCPSPLLPPTHLPLNHQVVEPNRERGGGMGWLLAGLTQDEEEELTALLVSTGRAAGARTC